MSGREETSRQDVELVELIEELETALVEYVEKFGPSDRAYRALRMSSLWHALAKDNPHAVGLSVR